MNGLVLFLIGAAVLICGYIFYGRWLCKQWGVGESNTETPAHTMNDGVDYVPAKAPVLMGHHFSSIAGAGPITGPIQAAMFGWLPCVLWILIGGIFFGGVHDFGALFASVRHGGKSIGEIISINMSKRAKRLFIIFAYLTLILVVAAFAAIVAETFGNVKLDGTVLSAAQADTNAQVAMVSLLFILIAIVFGFMVYRRNAPMGISTIAGVAAIVLCLVIGMKWHPFSWSANTWMWIVAAYITIASVTPVWILLQPRDYLSSFLLYAMLAVATFGVFTAHPQMQVTVNAEGGEAVKKGLDMIGSASKPIFPVLFTTIACGAISGFHSLVGSGTTSKQLDKEKDAKPIAYGGMLLECALAIITLVAIAYARQIGTTAGATDIFAGGVAGMASSLFGGKDSSVYNVLYTLLVLTYSAFCLTSLDTATRMGRFMFQEFWLDSSKGETPANVTGAKKFLTNPWVATMITVVLGVLLGLNGYGQIWALFGSANQLLAALALLAIAAWLGNMGRNNKMAAIPMCFMLVVTVTSLVINCLEKWNALHAADVDAALTALKLKPWGAWAQVIIGVLLIVLSVVLAVEGIQTLLKPKKQNA